MFIGQNSNYFCFSMKPNGVKSLLYATLLTVIKVALVTKFRKDPKIKSTGYRHLNYYSTIALIFCGLELGLFKKERLRLTLDARP